MARPGVTMTASFTEDGRVCEMMIEPQSKVTSSKKLDRVIDELVPVHQRGRLIRDITFSGGCTSNHTTDYEHVMISRTVTCIPQSGKPSATLRKTLRWTALSDLNWSRLTAWRALIAGFYDVPEYRPLFDQLDRVVIKYTPPSSNLSAISTRALLLGGWLASRPGWKLNARASKREGNSSVFEFAADGRTIQLEFAHTERAIEEGHLALVTLESAADRSALFSVRRRADGNRIETAVTLADEKRARRVLSYESLSESGLIARELEILGHDCIYEQAVLAAGEIIGS